MFDAVEALGRASGAEKDKAIARFALEAAEHVHAPRLCESPLRYELSLRENFSYKGSNLYLCAIDSVSAADDAVSDDGSSYDIVAANPLLASQKNYCCLGAQDVLGAWC